MAASAFTVDELVLRVRRTLQLRGNNAKLTKDEIIQICDEEIQQNLFPQLMRVREDYQVSRIVQLLTPGQSTYRIPARAASSTIDHIDLVQITGATPVAAHMLSRVETPNIAAFTSSPAGQPKAYALFGDTLQILPAPDTNAAGMYVLLIYYEGRPARLVPTSDCLQIISCVVSGINPSDLTIKINGTIASMNLPSPEIDLVPGSPPLMPFITDATLVDVTGDPVLEVFPGYSTAAALIASSIVPGSWMTPPGQTCVFPLPDAWWSTAVLACSASVAMAVGDPDMHAVLRAESDASIERLIAFQSSRVRKQPHALFNRQSPMRRNPYRGGIS